MVCSFSPSSISSAPCLVSRGPKSRPPCGSGFTTFQQSCQSSHHLHDTCDLPIQSRFILWSDIPQVSAQNQKIAQLLRRAVCDGKALQQFLCRAPAIPFREIRRNRVCCPAKLRNHPKLLTPWEQIRQAIDFKHEPMSLLPDHEILKSFDHRDLPSPVPSGRGTWVTGHIIPHQKPQAHNSKKMGWRAMLPAGPNQFHPLVAL